MTGHQDLRPAATRRWVAGELDVVIEDRGISCGVTCLAAGADQMYAARLARRGIPYVAIVPCCNYERSFARPFDLGRYRRFLRLAACSEVLDFSCPSEQAYFAGGKRVVRSCDLLIAVWDGRPAHGLGGTGDVVGYAVEQGKAVVHIDPLAHTVRLLRR